MELEERRARDEQVAADGSKTCSASASSSSSSTCWVFAARWPISATRSSRQQGKVHGKTLNAIRDRIDRFHQMNVFGDQATRRRSWPGSRQQISG
jgi:hypothetical protein